MRAKVTRTYMLVALGFTLFLLVALAALEIFPMTNGSNDLMVTSQANFQLARDEAISKDVLILADAKNPNHAQAIGELQIVLPQFQQVQIGLANGDASIGLPPNPPDSVRTALSNAQSDYLAIATATKAILAHPDASAADPIQVAIVHAHEQDYIREMAQVVSLVRQNAEAKRLQLFLIEMGLIVAIGVLVILKFALFTKGAIDRMIQREETCRKEEGDEYSSNP